MQNVGFYDFEQEFTSDDKVDFRARGSDGGSSRKGENGNAGRTELELDRMDDKSRGSHAAPESSIYQGQVLG